MSEFVPSAEQQAIFDAFLNGTGNIAVSALAGTGKTTSLVELAKRLPASGSKLFCAFNRDIVGELEQKLRGTGVTTRTFHSIGLAALKKHLGVKDVKTDGQKYRAIVSEWAQESIELRDAIAQAVVNQQDPEERDKAAKELFKDSVRMADHLTNLLRLKLVEWDDQIGLRDLVQEYRLDDDINNDEDIIAVIITVMPRVMLRGEQMVREALTIDFTDMIYWVVRWNARVYGNTYVFVDESQDLSPVQRELVRKCIYERGGRIVIIGDPNQAIYFFAGADSDSFDRSVEMFKAKVLPLNTTRRCPRVITEHAAQLVPQFVCPPDKPRGKVVWLDETRLVGVAEPGDMVLSRVKAPLVAACLDFIAAGKPATILGSEIGKALIAMLEKLENRKGYAFDKLLDVLDAYEEEQVKKWTDKGDDVKIQSTQDSCAALRVIIETANATTMETLKDAVDRLFLDDKTAKYTENGKREKIILATAHKSKGLEAKRVFILKPEKLPLMFPGLTPEAAQQEMNLVYVVRTRAKDTLVYLTNPKFLKDNYPPPYVQTTLDDMDWSHEDQQAPRGIYIRKEAPAALPEPTASRTPEMPPAESAPVALPEPAPLLMLPAPSESSEPESSATPSASDSPIGENLPEAAPEDVLKRLRDASKDLAAAADDSESDHNPFGKEAPEPPTPDNPADKPTDEKPAATPDADKEPDIAPALPELKLVESKPAAKFIGGALGAKQPPPAIFSSPRITGLLGQMQPNEIRGLIGFLEVYLEEREAAR